MAKRKRKGNSKSLKSKKRNALFDKIARKHFREQYSR